MPLYVRFVVYTIGASKIPYELPEDARKQLEVVEKYGNSLRVVAIQFSTRKDGLCLHPDGIGEITQEETQERANGIIPENIEGMVSYKTKIPGSEEILTEYVIICPSDAEIEKARQLL
ncbi:MAG: hypothetical protein QXM68_03235 [Candidatus Aenigmatarchaeota archaeon]|nr:hypothetical protein [Candidatus Aenigmarchaeota archaeon]